jgi:RNA polymerase sigma factor (sigma-70 family)
MSIQRDTLLRPLRRWLAAQTSDPLTDGQLLESFTRQRDDKAFSALLERHGPMVLRVCRRALADAQDAEDALQATFLILARKADSIIKRGSIGAWLHGVALRVARRVQRANTRRRARENRWAEQQPETPREETSWREACALLDEELQRLPENYRAPLVLCCLEGRSRDEAARQLGWSLGTLKRRLEQGRDVLRNRLARRGMELPAVLLALEVSASKAPAALLAATARAACPFAAGEAIPTTAAVTLANGVLDVMKRTKLKIVTVLLMACVTGAGLCLHQVVAQPTAVPQDSVASADPLPAKPPPRTDLHGDPLPPNALARIGTVRWRHGGGLHILGFAADGKQLVTREYHPEAVVRFWDARSGQELNHLSEGGPNAASQPMALSPDGRILATARANGAIRLCDVASGKDLPQFQATVKDGVVALAFAPDGKTLVAAGKDQIVRRWLVETGKEAAPFEKQTAAKHWTMATLTFLAEGKVLASAGLLSHHREEGGRVILDADFKPQVKTVRFWDTETGKELSKLEEPQDEKRKFDMRWKFAPDGKTWACLGVDGSVYVFDVTTGKELRQLGEKGAPGDRYQIALAIAPDGRTLAVANKDQTVHLWDLATGKERHHLGKPRKEGFLAALLFSPDSKNLVTAGNQDATMRVWDTETGQEVRQLEGWSYVNYSSGLVFSPDGKTLAAGIVHTIRLWDMATGKVMSPTDGLVGTVASVVVAPDGRSVTTTSWPDFSNVRQWDPATGKELRRIPLPHAPTLIAPDCRTLVAHGEKNRLHLWDLTAGKELGNIEQAGEQAYISPLAFSPDSRVLVTTGTDKLLRFWDSQTGRLRSQTTPPADPGTPLTSRVSIIYRTAVFSPDGRTLAAIYWDEYDQKALEVTDLGARERKVQLFDVATGKQLGQLELPQPGLQAIAWAPDGRTLALAHRNNTIAIFEVATARERHHFKGTAERLAFSADGRFLAGCSFQERLVRLWDPHSGKELAQFAGHKGGVSSLAFALDSRTLLSGSSDTTALVWDVSGLKLDPGPAPADLEVKQVEALWADLLKTDAAAGFKAIQTLQSAPRQAQSWLQEYLKPVAGVDDKRIARYATDLESSDFNVRQKASDELEKLGELAGPTLTRMLNNKPALEVQQRIEKLLDKLATLQVQPETLRALRAIEVLEQLATPEARQQLQRLASGAPGARQTLAAQASLERLDKRAARDK